MGGGGAAAEEEEEKKQDSPNVFPGVLTNNFLCHTIVSNNLAVCRKSLTKQIL